MSLEDEVKRYGYTAKLVRAICAARGWRYDKNGAPAEWYAAWRAGIGAAIESAAIDAAVGDLRDLAQ